MIIISLRFGERVKKKSEQVAMMMIGAVAIEEQLVDDHIHIQYP